MSKQTMESLEQSEKRVEAAEKVSLQVNDLVADGRKCWFFENEKLDYAGN
jgi:hypothetical protein